MDALGVPTLLLVGGLLAFQAAANVQLSAALESPFGASTLQLGLGATVLVSAAAAALSLSALARVDRMPAWHLLGGLGSSLYITAGILLVPRLGAVVSVGLFIAGQMLASLLVDGRGWLDLPAKGIHPAGVVGAVAVLAGAGLVVRGATRAGGGRRSGAVALAAWVVLALAAGAGLPVQGAINARLRADLDAPLAAAAFSFLVATAAMALVLFAALALGRTSPPRPARLRTLPWWGWLGGACGAVYVTSVFLFIPRIGAAPVVALTVGGQQLASLLVDRFALLRLPRRPIPPLRLAGVSLLLVGVVLVQLT